LKENAAWQRAAFFMRRNSGRRLIKLFRTIGFGSMKAAHASE